MCFKFQKDNYLGMNDVLTDMANPEEAFKREEKRRNTLSKKETENLRFFYGFLSYLFYSDLYWETLYCYLETIYICLMFFKQILVKIYFEKQLNQKEVCKFIVKVNL